MNPLAGHIGIFGGSFNPPHVSHVLACHYALMRWGLRRIIVVPSFQHPFGKPLPAFEHRLEMVKIAFRHLGDFIEVSDVERRMGGVSFTVDTIKQLKSELPGEHLHLIVGGDILSETHKWRAFDEIERLAPLLIVPRLVQGKVLGGDPGDAVLPEVSSTALRDRLAAGEKPSALPDGVWEYMQSAARE